MDTGSPIHIGRILTGQKGHPHSSFTSRSETSTKVHVPRSSRKPHYRPRAQSTPRR
jgi:hypothetical protein